MTVAIAEHLPRSIEEVTRRWVSDAFAADYSGVKVTALTIDKGSHGTASRLRLLLEYNDAGRAAGLPPSMYLKISLNPLHLEIASNLFESEARFYRDIAPTIPDLLLPRCYLTRVDSEGRSAIFLEDMETRGVRFGDIRQPISAEVVRNLLEWLALLHARYWGDPMLDAMKRLPTDKVSGFSGFVLRPENWEQSMASARAENAPPELRDRERVEAAYLAMLRANSAQTQCVTHGDLHMGNMFFMPDGTAGYIDWQGFKSGCWAYDTAYFIVGNIPIEARRAQEKELLSFYLDKLAHYLCNFRPDSVAVPTWDEAWLAYRQNIVRGYCWIGCPVSTQPEDICRLNSDRFLAAAIDHDMLGALGA
jgi:hypothetical protein